MADHISDTFLDTLVPLMLLVEAAQDGNQKEVEECAIVFTEGAARLEEVRLYFREFCAQSCQKNSFNLRDHGYCSLLQVANLACSVSSNAEGVKFVRVVTKNIHALCPQVSQINTP